MNTLEELVKLKEAYCRCDGTQEAEDAAILAILNKIDELPHPTMTAVGYVDGERIHELREGRLNLALWAECCGNANTPVYTTPPAAVPVEALEGLVERLMSKATNPYTHPLDSAMLEYAADELTQLITVHSGHKERSNG